MEMGVLYAALDDSADKIYTMFATVFTEWTTADHSVILVQFSGDSSLVRSVICPKRIGIGLGLRYRVRVRIRVRVRFSVKFRNLHNSISRTNDPSDDL